MSTEDHKWYVVRCFSGHEKKVREFLAQETVEMGLEEKISEILIPTETVVEIRGGKKRTREKNFFPGYILVNALYDDSVNNLISNAPSVIGFLKTDKDSKRPAPLRQDEVDRILGHVNHNKEVAATGGHIEIPYRVGDIIKVIDGPFKDFDGTVEEIYPDKLKLRVLVSIFGRKTPVEVDVNQVEADA
ncbi:transcription termination/antitermination protein NusG [Halomonas sp. BM-2019]|uniref:transcription termination/antitermination protein NusG n=1 Tax=Halomonas sp. BM-2019 TaxID=2811227 RepID=UPI001B3C1A2F|nr:MAG: transcription termination/antitermination factor NusG [Halomonas sp. BM-2019]